ncbi:MAG: imidazole glycerol phosphate synthase subunit HisH [bacterium]
MIVIVDYGMGNLRSVQKAIEHVGSRARISSSASEIACASSLILPGVGAFGAAAANLRKKKLIKPILAHAASQKPFLGICLGFELLFQTSTEGGLHKGLGILEGTVMRFPFKGSSAMPVPHMGWNKIIVSDPATQFEKLCADKYFYFVHSYCVKSSDRSARFASADYGIRFKAAVQKKNIYGCQFHPEKSGEDGIKIIKYFVKKGNT